MCVTFQVNGTTFAHRDILDMKGNVDKTPIFNQDLKEFNLRMGKDIEAKGGKVVFIGIEERSRRVMITN